MGSDSKVCGDADKPATASVTGNLDSSFVICNVYHMTVQKTFSCMWF